DLDRAPRRELDAVGGLEKREVRTLPDREDAGIRLDDHEIAIVVDRREAAAGVEHGADGAQLDRFEPAVADEPSRAAAGQEPDPLPPRLLELFVPLRRAQDRHFVELLERDDGDFACAAADGRARRVEGFLHAGVGVRRIRRLLVVLARHAPGGPRRVEGDEAAADHDDAAAEVHAIAAVDVEQVVDGLDHAVLFDARRFEIAAARHADGQEDRFEALGAQLGEPERRRQRPRRFESYAEREDLVDLGADEGARKAVLGNAEAHHAAGLFGRVEDGHGVAAQRQIVRGGKAGRPGADDRNPARTAPRRRRMKRQRLHRQMAGIDVALGDGLAAQPILRVGTRRFDAVLLGEKALQGADGDRRVDRAAAAGVLTGSGADAPADGGEWIGRARDEERFLDASFGNELHVPPGVGLYRTRRLALDLRFPMTDLRQLDRNRHSTSGPGRAWRPPTRGPMTAVIEAQKSGRW